MRVTTPLPEGMIIGAPRSQTTLIVDPSDFPWTPVVMRPFTSVSQLPSTTCDFIFWLLMKVAQESPSSRSTGMEDQHQVRLGIWMVEGQCSRRCSWMLAGRQAL